MERVLLISPVRNEARHLELVLAAMAAQTRPPDEWIVVDDHSTDNTRELLEQARTTLPFLTVVDGPGRQLPEGVDRLAHAAAPRAFNHGLSFGSGFSHVGKLDGDIELPPDYFERILGRFKADPSLGIAGGTLVEFDGGCWRSHGVSYLEHVRGAVKLYSRECFTAINGIRELLGWDCIDEVLARRHGYRTRSFPDASARHHRPTGSAQGRVRGAVRWGRAMYVEGYPPAWVAARSLKMARTEPRLVSGLAYLGGYAHAAASGVPRFDEDGYRRQLRGELRRRAGTRLRMLASR